MLLGRHDSIKDVGCHDLFVLKVSNWLAFKMQIWSLHFSIGSALTRQPCNKK
ncbi:hypothetical protein D8674_019104 [Pyrus ussuriensis x Pyrus communis]|uniref:Uncharacterized protein n=1 Tax=Pyrus ussuriensis x Pyrus communis TaxID=2448454 RepID=A0A5N5GCA1_9ROSA|nr:hypothetical protein D8674_019104 [Pyrus ussuriensis x Pyrus communis]